MHHQVGVGDLLMDLFDASHCKNLAVRLASELICSMACADRHGQSIHAGFFNEAFGFVRIGQELIVAELAFGTVAILGFAMPRFQRAQATQFAFDRNPLGMGQLHYAPCDIDVVFVGGRCFAILFERPVHHDRGESVLNRRQTSLGRVAVVLVHDDRNAWIELDGREHEVSKVGVLGISPSPSRGLDNHRRVCLLGRLHDGLDLLHIIDVKGGYAVVVFSSVVEDFTKRYQSHVGAPEERNSMFKKKSKRLPGQASDSGAIVPDRIGLC